jgi:hypothetical protein
MAACIPPSYILPSEAAALFGVLAEGSIAKGYLAHVGRPAFYPALPAKDFFDISVGFGNLTLYAAFLNLHHPALGTSRLSKLASERQVKIPDLLTYDPPKSTEFYEIKPNSPDGRAAGRKKVPHVHALYQSFGLPYVPGMQWNPDNKMELFSGSLFGIEVFVYFHYFSLQPGLIVYEVCAEGKLRPLTAGEIALIIFTILLIILSDGALIPVLAI